MSLVGLLTAARNSPSLCDDTLLLLTLDWLDVEDIMAFDIANLSNRCMRSAWLRALCTRDIECMIGLLYDHHLIRWSIMRKVRTLSMLVAEVSADCRKQNTFEAISLPGLKIIRVDCGHDMTDKSVRLN